MKAFVNIILILTWFPAILFSQENQIISDVLDTEKEARIDSLINDIFMSDPELMSLISDVKLNQFHYIYFRSSAASKTTFAGREIGENQINLGNQLFYINGSGLYGGLAGAWYSQLDPAYRTTVLTGGYANSLFNIDALRIRFSYQRYLSHVSDPLYEPLYKQGINAGFSLYNGKLGLNVDGALNFGNYDTAKSLSAEIFGNIPLYKKGIRKKITLRPILSVLYGIDYQEFMLDETFIDPYTGSEYTSYYQDQFGLMNIQLNVPLNIIYNNFDFNFPGNIICPGILLMTLNIRTFRPCNFQWAISLI